MKPHLKHISEDKLLALYYQEQDNVYVGELLSRYTLRLLGVCLKYLKEEEAAKDMVQQVFEKVLLELGKYEIENFGGWLYRIAQNACISAIRSGRHFVEEEQLRYVPSDNGSDIDHLMLQDRQHEHLKVALERLKPDQQICVSLFFLHKKSYQEIADLHQFNIKEVKSNIQNGKRNLRIIMEGLEKNANVKR